VRDGSFPKSTNMQASQPSEEHFDSLGVLEMISDAPLDATRTHELQQCAGLVATVLERAIQRRHARSIKQDCAKLAMCLSRDELRQSVGKAISSCLQASASNILLVDSR
jgi:hypothetical protein